MSLQDFLRHKCDIYHLITTEESIGYGFGTTKDKIFSYPADPDVEGVDCHFHTKTFSSNLEQAEPDNDFIVTRKLTLPIGTDIRMNDKVVEVSSGLEYTARHPLNIRDHHISVTLYRTESQKPI